MEIKLTENEMCLMKIGRDNAKDTNKFYREFYDLFKNQPDRLRRVDTSNSEAIVGSANIDEIAEHGRNDRASH